MIILYSDGNPYRISWVIETGRHTHSQWRNQAEIYYNKVSQMQAKFMALHVGLFWGIGVFAIKTGDDIRVLLDDHDMMSCMRSGHSDDMFSDRRIHFITMLAEQRRLGMIFEHVDAAENPASILL